MSTKSIKLKTEDQTDVILPIYDTDPTDPVPGQMYFNKPNIQVKIFNGEIWGRFGIAWDPSDSDK